MRFAKSGVDSRSNGAPQMQAWTALIRMRYPNGAVVSWPVNLDSVSGDDSGTEAMYGVGLEWKLNETWSLTVEWDSRLPFHAPRRHDTSPTLDSDNP